jgi:hypothetical protein
MPDTDDNQVTRFGVSRYHGSLGQPVIIALPGGNVEASNQDHMRIRSVSHAADTSSGQAAFDGRITCA